MIRHVVLFALAAEDPEQKRKDAEAMRERMEALAPVIPGVLSLQVGVDLGLVAGHWDVGLVSEHESQAALEAYQRHPQHVEVLEFVSTVVAQKACVDYALPAAGGDR